MTNKDEFISPDKEEKDEENAPTNPEEQVNKEEEKKSLSPDEETKEDKEKEAPQAEESEEEDTEKVLLAQLEELKDSHLRLHAEYDNYRKRTMREKSDLLKYAAEKVVIDFLEVLDDFDRAIESIPQDDEVGSEMRSGIELIRDKMIAKLRGQGVKEMEVIGRPFDPEEHDAVAMVPTEDPKAKGTIIDCVQKGYTLADKVIRHPKVVVGQ